MNSTTFTTKSFWRLRLHALAAMVLLGAGCAQLPGQDSTGKPGEARVDTRIVQSDHKMLFAFAREFPKLTAEAQRAEVAHLNQAAGNPQSRLMLAMAYGLPNSATRDSTKAQTLLDEIAANKQLDEASLTLATVMRDYLGELNKSAQKLKEEQKRAEAVQLKLDELQKKLDDLKNIEKTMVDRDQGVKK